jgi:hypothetical protein
LEQALNNMERSPLSLEARNYGIRNYRKKIEALEKKIKELRG